VHNQSGPLSWIYICNGQSILSQWKLIHRSRDTPIKYIWSLQCDIFLDRSASYICICTFVWYHYFEGNQYCSAIFIIVTYVLSTAVLTTWDRFGLCRLHRSCPLQLLKLYHFLWCKDKWCW